MDLLAMPAVPVKRRDDDTVNHCSETEFERALVEHDHSRGDSSGRWGGAPGLVPPALPDGFASWGAMVVSKQAQRANLG
jgi:hypothetical protein